MTLEQWKITTITRPDDKDFVLICIKFVLKYFSRQNERWYLRLVLYWYIIHVKNTSESPTYKINAMFIFYYWKTISAVLDGTPRLDKRRDRLLEFFWTFEGITRTFCPVNRGRGNLNLKILLMKKPLESIHLYLTRVTRCDVCDILSRSYKSPVSHNTEHCIVWH